MAQPSSTSSASLDDVPAVASITLLLSPTGLDSLKNAMTALGMSAFFYSETDTSSMLSNIVSAIVQTGTCGKSASLNYRPRSQLKYFTHSGIHDLGGCIAYRLDTLFTLIGSFDRFSTQLVTQYLDTPTCFLTSLDTGPPYFYAPELQNCTLHSLQGVDALAEYAYSNTARIMQLCVPTVVLTVNILIGDAIVWWRVLALWPENHRLRWLALLLLASTFGKPWLPHLEKMS
ncbi:hypothetical protein C2E23DRAFT_861269 [Lenzites betulinus]|nr:hypothetical protein C2E23DRAFT_861269 [Lenzites betulinus]